MLETDRRTFLKGLALGAVACVVPAGLIAVPAADAAVVFPDPAPVTLAHVDDAGLVRYIMAIHEATSQCEQIETTVQGDEWRSYQPCVPRLQTINLTGEASFDFLWDLLRSNRSSKFRVEFGDVYQCDFQAFVVHLETGHDAGICVSARLNLCGPQVYRDAEKS